MIRRVVYSMSKPKDSLRDFVGRYSDDVVMLDAIYIWSQNPTSKSAGYGVDENYHHIEQTLKSRYDSTLTKQTIQDRDFEEIVGILQNEMAEITDEYIQSHSDAIYKIRSDIEELYEELGLDEEFRDRVKSRIQKLDERSQKGVLLLSELLKSKFGLDSEEVKTSVRTRHLTDFSHYFQALFEQEAPENELFVEAGILNRLLWISSGSSREEPEYVLPGYLEPLILDIEDHVEVSIEIPEIESYLDTLFDGGQIASFEQLLFREDGYSEDTNLDLPTKTGIVNSYGKYHVISPFIQEELQNKYQDHRAKHLEENSKIQSTLSDLSDALQILDKRHRPRSEFVDFRLNSEDLNYQATIVLEDTQIEVVLIDYISELARQHDFGDNTLLVLVDQRIPEAERQLNQIDANINALLIYADEIYGLTSLNDSVREIIDELAVRDYDLKEVEIENISSSSTPQQSFHETIDEHIDAELWSSTVQRAGSKIEDLMHEIYRENSSLPDPDQHKQAIDQIGQMDQYGLGQWIGYFRKTNLFQQLDEAYNFERQYFRSKEINRINEVYNEVKHPPRKDPAPQEAREIATLAKNIIDETKQYTGK